MLILLTALSVLTVFILSHTFSNSFGAESLLNSNKMMNLSFVQHFCCYPLSLGCH